MNLDQVTYDLSAVSSGQSCKGLYQPREAQGGPSDGPGKSREGPSEGLRESQRLIPLLMSRSVFVCSNHICLCGPSITWRILSFEYL